MASLGDNISSLARLRQQRATAMANLAEPLRLTLVAPLDGNPGELRMLSYVPPGLPAGAPLVVVLHGCTQNAAAYDHGAGWSTLAERHGFALLFPEQQRSNNAQLCFNWFQPEDVTRGHGEVESIRLMIVQMIRTHTLNARRVFITGLSAGGAMTAAMLATAPELFAGGAIIAGLPYASATSIPEALTAMGHGARHSAREWGNKVRAASPHAGPWPAIQVWHGTEDAVVQAGNADEAILQWSDVLGLPATAPRSETIDGARHDIWPGPDGRPALERWTVPGLGHGTPITPDAADNDHAAGSAGPHMLASSISSTWRLAHDWGLLTQAASVRAPRRVTAKAKTAGSKPLIRLPGQAGTIVEKALRAAGLLR